MGVIIRNGIKGTLLSYIGVVLGFINSAVLQVFFLADVEIGLLRLLLEYAGAAASIFGLGVSNMIVRIFPKIEDANAGHLGILPALLAVSFIGCVIFLIAFYFGHPLLYKNKVGEVLLSDYIIFMVPMVLIQIFFNLLDGYLRATLSVIVGAFHREIVLRVGIIIGILLYAFDYVGFGGLLLTIIVTYAISLTAMFLQIFIEKKAFFSTRFVDKVRLKEHRGEMSTVSLNSMATGLTSVAVRLIDAMMVNYFLGLKLTGIYSITFYFGTMVSVPARSIKRVSDPILAQLFAKNDMVLIEDTFKKSCITMGIIGGLIFLGIYVNLDPIFEILKSDFKQGYWVAIFIGIGHYLYMITGVNYEVISNSKYYVYNSYFTILMLVTMVVANLILIPQYGITGAALASLITMAIVNIGRQIFIQWRLKIVGWDSKTLLLTILVATFALLSHFIPHFSNAYFDILFRIVMVTTFYTSIIYWSNWSLDFNNLLVQTVRKITGLK